METCGRNICLHNCILEKVLNCVQIKVNKLLCINEWCILGRNLLILIFHFMHNFMPGTISTTIPLSANIMAMIQHYICLIWFMKYEVIDEILESHRKNAMICQEYYNINLNKSSYKLLILSDICKATEMCSFIIQFMPLKLHIWCSIVLRQIVYRLLFC